MATMNEWQFWCRVVRMAAAVIGAVAALWLLSGDRNPEARVQHPEAALGRTVDMPPIVGMSGDEYTQTVTVEHFSNFDRDGVFFFSLRFPSGERVVISADDDLTVSQWLVHREGSRVQLTLRDMPRINEPARNKGGAR